MTCDPGGLHAVSGWERPCGAASAQGDMDSQEQPSGLLRSGGGEQHAHRVCSEAVGGEHSRPAASAWSRLFSIQGAVETVQC